VLERAGAREEPLEEVQQTTLEGRLLEDGGERLEPVGDQLPRQYEDLPDGRGHVDERVAERSDPRPERVDRLAGAEEDRRQRALPCGAAQRRVDRLEAVRQVGEGRASSVARGHV